ncbi:hypothetical protein J32TS2_28070 [Shouchella clausii]|uniref:hypothetical protein n=1 Tax=Shouchella clausii TaxID=79880 RepID=UPI000BA5BE0C|nr:hypothetical protein [Shouchella clausii]PAD46648.1 hypothetical protein CHI09_11010 [Shouchella clausii]GIN17451.1 hypothetical protein J32TS2_28070 [Shouchella clausii]
MSKEKGKKEWFKKLLAMFLLALNDFLFIVGAVFILVATYRYSTNIGLILTGVFFMFYSFLLSKQRG